MRIGFLVPALAALAAIPSTQALEIGSGDDLKVDIGMRLQARIEIASAKDAGGDAYDIREGASETGDNDPQQVNLMFRRARVWFSGSYKENTLFSVTLDADNLGAKDANGDAGVDVLYAWVAQKFKTGDLTQEVKFGKENPGFAPASFISTAKLLFPASALSAGAQVPANMGLHYTLKHELVNVYAGIIEGEGKGTTAGSLAGSDNNDWYLFARGETAFGSKIPAHTESWLGKDGLDWLVGAGVSIKTDGNGDDDGATTFLMDGKVHYNALSSMATFVYRSTDTAADKVNSMMLEAQAGYVVTTCANGTVIEPALRLSYVDADTDEDEEQSTYNADGQVTDSGIYLDAGCNFYFAEHTSKLQAALTYFSPEDGDGTAVIFRVQQQLSF